MPYQFKHRIHFTSEFSYSRMYNTLKIFRKILFRQLFNNCSKKNNITELAEESHPPLDIPHIVLTRARQITQRFKGMNNGYGLTL